MKKRALVISYYYYPDKAVGGKRPSQLSKTLISNGWDVDVITRKLDPSSEEKRKNSGEFGQITSVYQFPGIVNPIWSWTKKLRSDRNTPDSEPVIPQPKSTANEVQAPASSNESLLARMRRVLFSVQAILSATKSWAALSLFYLLINKLKGRQYDLIISSSPTDSTHFLALIAKRLFSAPWIMDLRDPLVMWGAADPETVTRFRVSFEDWLERKYYRNADALVVTSPSLSSELVLDHGVDQEKVTVVYNGFDGDTLEQDIFTGGPLKAIFAGSLYFNRNPIPLFEAIKQLKEQGRLSNDLITFDFYGDCTNWNGISLTDWVVRHGIDELVSFKGFLPANELEHLLENYHLLLNFAQYQPKQIPAKTFDYLRYPGIMMVVAESDSDTSRLISDHKLGLTVNPDAERLAEVMDQFIESQREAQLKYAPDHDSRIKFSRNEQNQVYLRLAEKVCL